MTNVARAAVVVGIDGSDTSLTALEWAVREAARRALPLRVLHAWSVPIPPVAMGPAVMRPDDDVLRQAASEVLDSAVERARAVDPRVEVVGKLEAGPPATLLLEAADHAALLVVGTSGLDTFSEFFLGSISMQCVTHASCPVAVVPRVADLHEAGPDAGRVVVGIDGSPLSVDAAHAAFEAASVRGVGLTLLHVWNAPGYDTAGITLPNTMKLDEAHQDELRDMAETVDGLQEKYPDVQVEQRLEQGKPGKVLAAASRGAELIVVGSRGHGGFARLMLGSTSHSLLHHAECPVLVVRPGTM